MRSRFLIKAGAVTALLAFGGLSAYWVWAADQVARAVEQWTAEQRSRGYDIAYQGPEITGFPAKLALGFTEPRIAAPQGWRWSGGAIAGEATLWQPTVLHLTLPQRQRLVAAWRGHLRDLTLEAEAAQAFIHLGQGGWARAATIDMNDITLQEQSGWIARAKTLHYAVTRRPPTMEGADDWTLSLSGETSGITLPEQLPSPLGAQVEKIAFDATLIGAIQPGEPAEALARWRDSGGLLEIKSLTLAWGPLNLKAGGTATLDAQLRPEGAFSARITGLPETMDILVAKGMIDPNAAFAIKVATLTLAGARDENGRAVIRLPITLQDGRFYLGPVALFELAPVL